MNLSQVHIELLLTVKTNQLVVQYCITQKAQYEMLHHLCINIFFLKSIFFLNLAKKLLIYAFLEKLYWEAEVNAKKVTFV